MTDIKHGTVTVTVPDSLALPEKAGKLTPDEILRLPKARRGLGLVGQHVAAAMSKLGAAFIAPAGVTAESVLAKCERAEQIDQVITDNDVVQTRLKQGNLMMDADAWEDLLKINDQVKAQAKHDPEIAKAFEFLREYMKRHGAASKDHTEE